MIILENFNKYFYNIINEIPIIAKILLAKLETKAEWITIDEKVSLNLKSAVQCAQKRN